LSSDFDRRGSADTIDVGRITRPHGVRGWVKARPHWSESRALLEVSSVYVSQPEQQGCWMPIEHARMADKAVLLKLAGVSDREAAEALRGASLSVYREQLGELEPGEFYLCDLVGAEVTVAGAAYGEVVEVRSHPTLDTIVVRLLDGELVEQPLVAPWLERVDVAAGKVDFSTADGAIT
jgi:16S rRNA processing protein RimM